MTLAFALDANPGGYALLLGAGISIPAGVPSARDVQRFLLLRLAAAEGEGEPGDPFAWYHHRYGEHSTYETLLATLTSSPTERMNLLCGFFEPTEEERHADPDAKRPTAAHRAIARLVAAGAIRVVLSTNFDTLTETALREAGVEPVVLSTPEAIAGRMPLHTYRCVVVHLHGDYLSPGMLNTQDELGSYPLAVNELLDDVLRDYGLVAVGWSAVSDTALRAAVERAPSRRFATYWCEPAPLSEHAARLVAHRQANVATATAERFLTDVADAHAAIRDTARTDPRDITTAVAAAKRALTGDATPIGFHDQLRRALDTLRASPPLNTDDFNTGTQTEFTRRYNTLTADLELPVALVAVAAYWGNAGTDVWWLDDLSRFGAYRHVGGSTALIALTRLPSLVLFYAAGTAAIAARRHDLVRTLLTEPTASTLTGTSEALWQAFTPDTLYVPGGSQGLSRLLKPTFVRQLALGPAVYRDAFETWQYLLLLTSVKPGRSPGYLSFIPYLRVRGFDPMHPLISDAVRAGEWLDTLAAADLIDAVHIGAITDEINNAIADHARQADSRLIPTGGGMLPSGPHYPGSYTDVDE